MEQDSKGFAPWRVAKPWRRIVAQWIDQSTVLASCAATMILLFPHKVWTIHWWAGLFFLHIYMSLTLQIFMLWIFGTTPGKKLTGLRVDFARPKGKTEIIPVINRCTAWWLGVFTLGATWMTVFRSPDRRAWHDLVADTVVVHETEEPDFAGPTQKILADGWLALLAVFFAAELMLGLMIQFRHLKAPATPANIQTSAADPLETAGWYVLAGAPLSANANPTFTDSQKKLYQDMNLFVHGRELSPGKRFEFYKENMEPLENELCKAGQSASLECQSAQSMAQLLSTENSKTSHAGALAAFKLMEQVETIPHLAEQIDFLNHQSEAFPESSFQRQAVRAWQGKLLMRSGDFNSARNVFTTVNTAELKSFGVEQACQAEALNDCEFSHLKTCLEDPYWKSWSSGCALQKAPSKFEMSAQALGYWWSQAKNKNGKFESLAGWKKTREAYLNESSERSTASDTGSFERFVIEALDFALELKSTQPGDLVGKSKNMSPENPLWGWAQSQALAEFGEQWAYLVNPAEHKEMVRLALIEKTKRAAAPSSGQITLGSEKPSAPAASGQAPSRRE